MSTTQSIGSKVTVGGTQYTIMSATSTDSSGSKFYGKFSFRLQDAAGNVFSAYGKRVAHNSRLTPVAAPTITQQAGMPEPITINIVEKPEGQSWRIIGTCPENVSPSSGLHVYTGGDGRHPRVLDCETSALVYEGSKGDSLAELLQKLANTFELDVLLTDETTWEETWYRAIKHAEYERDGFTYVTTMEYATDPATVADIAVGDVIRYTDRHGKVEVSEVIDAGRDEFGMYFGTIEVRTDGDYTTVFRTQASTINHVITRSQDEPPFDREWYAQEVSDAKRELATMRAKHAPANVPAQPASEPESAPEASVTPEPAPVAGIRFSVARKPLTDALAFVWKASGHRTVPVLAGVRMDASGDHVTLGCFDYDHAREVSLPAGVAAPGSVLVSAKELAAAVKDLSGDTVEFSISDGLLVATCGGTAMTFETMPVEDFPQLPAAMPNVGAANMTAFTTMVTRIAPSAGRDATLPMMKGIHLAGSDKGTLRGDACNRYQLASAEIDWKPVDGTTLDALPPALELADAAKAFAKVTGIGSSADVIIGTDGFWTSFEFASMRIVVRHSSDNPVSSYPSVAALYAPSYPITGEINTKDFLASIKRVMGGITGKGAVIRMAWQPGGKLTLECGSEGRKATETLACTFTGSEPLNVAINPSILADGLKGLSGDFVAVHMRTGVLPVVFASPGTNPCKSEPGTGRIRVLVMPLRLSGWSTDPADETPTTTKGKTMTTKKTAAKAEPAATPVSAPVQTPTTPEPVAPASVAHSVPEAAPAQPAPTGAPVIVEAMERIAQAVLVAMRAGQWNEARAQIADGRAQNAGYLVAGVKTWDAIASAVDAAEAKTAAKAETPATPVSAPVQTPTTPEPVAPASVAHSVPEAVPAQPADDATELDAATREALIAAHLAAIEQLRQGAGASVQIPAAPVSAPPAPAPAPVSTARPVMVEIAFTLAQWTTGAPTYGDSRATAREALSAAGITARMNKTSKREFVIKVADSDADHARTVIAGAVALETVDA